MRRVVRTEQGFTLVEVLLAMVLMAVGIAATLAVFGSSGRATVLSQQIEVATQKGQAELDRLSAYDYDKLGLTSTPGTSTNPKNPNSRVSGTTLTIRSGVTETFVLSTDTGQSGAAVNPTPTSFAVGTGDEPVTGSIYRYVTWRDENCPAGVCDGTQNTKRITVAVTINASGTLPARAPVWLSQIVPDPQALPPGTSAPPAGTGNNVTAQDFYLYDTRCGNTSRTSPTGEHSTHSTASRPNSGTSPASAYSVCENTTVPALQPDLMGDDVPTGDSSTPLYSYSNDLSGTYDGGLAMKEQGTTCPTSYAFTTGHTYSTSNPNFYSIHAWASNAFSTPFDLAGKATVSIFTEAMGGASGRGFVCATVIDRAVSAGVPTDTVLGSSTFDVTSWPTTSTRLSFTFNVTSTDLAAGHRLVFVLGVRSESANDLVFRYDHPLYPSFLEVSTDTPF
jgi:prepilin-type N-terminal cleavage/methylation domain-containing protein